MTPKLTFLGSGDSQGVPRWWCDCSVCQEARATGHNCRTRPSALLELPGQTVLLDASPELRWQMTREGNQRVDAVLITHAHNDHVLGLGDVGDMARWTGKPVPVYAPAEVLPQLKTRFPYMTHSTYTTLTPFAALKSGLELPPYRVTAHRVPHGYNGFAYGFRFEGARDAWGYVPDSIGLTDLSPWTGLELLVLGTSFYHEDAPTERRSVYDVTEALGLLKTLRPQRVVFTHLGHGVDARKRAPPGTQYAHDGLQVAL